MEKLRILLVEDDDALAMGTVYSLRDEGMEVTRADSFAALRSLEKPLADDFDCVLLDVMLPDGDGYQACSWIKENSHIPVIFLTALSDEGNVVHGLNMGGDDYVTKPFRIKELTARIRANVRKYMEGGSALPGGKDLKAAASEIFCIGEVELDKSSFSVRKSGQPVSLTPSEYRLLLELMEHAGQVLTRGTLIDRLWSVDEAFVDDNTLSVYIRRLREKLDEPGEESCIGTVRGVGYRYNL